MPARNQPPPGKAWTPEKVRERIKTTLIIKALSDHVLKGTEMSKTQVTAGIALLKKTVPDLAASQVTHSGPGGGPIQITSTDAEL
jgi:hypothetical protein